MMWYLISSLAFGAAGFLIYLYYWRKGQFEDPEDVKYQLLREKEPFDASEE